MSKTKVPTWVDCKIPSPDGKSRVFRADCGPFSLILARDTPDLLGRWVLNAPLLGIENEDVGPEDGLSPELAQSAARNIACNALNDLLKQMRKLA